MKLRVGPRMEYLPRWSCTLLCAALIFTLQLSQVHGLDNGVGRTPAMGWNSWNFFRCNISEAMVMEVADAIVATGLRDAGFKYVNIDDCWMEKRDRQGRVMPFASKFPSGMKALADYIHSKGLKFGVYSDTGNHTCEGYPGSWGHEDIDAKAYAEWGVDYLKYDYCGMEGVKETVQDSYARMSSALLATGRPILFSLCSWGSGQPWLWGKQVGHSWRTSIDVFAAWDTQQAQRLKLPSFLQPVMSAVAHTEALYPHAGPGGYNDPDMLVVGLDGMYPYGVVQDCPEHIRGCKPGMYISREKWGKVGGLTQTEQRAHFSFWCMMAAPLILGNDPRHMSKATLQILLAREVIAVNQDGLGKQAQKVWKSEDESSSIWVKEMEGGVVAVMLFNAGSTTQDITTVFGRDLQPWADTWARDDGFEPEGAVKCADQVPECKGWAEKGECERNPGFMLDKCPASCPGGCPEPDDPPGPKATALVRDLWLEEDVGFFTARFTAKKVEPHEARLVTVKFLEPATARDLLPELDRGVPAYINSMKRALDSFGGTMPKSEDDEDEGEGGIGTGAKDKNKDKEVERLRKRVAELVEALKRTSEKGEMMREMLVETSRKGKGKGGKGGKARASMVSSKSAAVVSVEDDEGLCSKDGHGCGGDAGKRQQQGSAAVSRRLGVLDGEEVGISRGGVGVGDSGAGWLSSWQAKLSLALNLLVVAAVAYAVLAARRRRRLKTARTVQ